MSLLETLSQPFPVEKVYQREGPGGKMLDYISIDTALNRLNEAAKLDWSFRITDDELRELDRGKWLSKVRGELTVLVATTTGQVVATTRSGIGVGVSNDPDMATKTALAEAEKKAAQRFGVGLYLWDEAEREKIAVARESTEPVSDDVVALQITLAELYEEAFDDVATKEKIMSELNCSEDELKDAEALSSLIQMLREQRNLSYAESVSS